jgi:hypothetical protein
MATQAAESAHTSQPSGFSPLTKEVPKGGLGDQYGTVTGPGGYNLPSLLSVAVGSPCVLHALDLAWCELPHACIIRVVHEVQDGVVSGVGGAGVAAGRAAECSRGLGGCSGSKAAQAGDGVLGGGDTGHAVCELTWIH